MKLYDKPFDNIEVFADGNETYQTQYEKSFNIRILRILYISNKKIVYKL